MAAAGRALVMTTLETDLPDTAAAPPAPTDELDLFRARHYGLLAVVLRAAPTRETLDLASRLTGSGSALGCAHAALAEAARRADPKAVEREYFRLFIGVGRGEIVPYGSFYQTGLLQEKPLARLRGDLAALGIERAPDTVDLEDHVGMLCETMAGLIDGRFDAPPGSDRAFFDAHLAPFVERFFADVERAEAANFYRHVGALGRAFVEIEADLMALAA